MPNEIKIATTTKDLKGIAAGAVQAGLKFKALIKSQADIASAQKAKLIDGPLKMLDSVLAHAVEPDQRKTYTQQRRAHAASSEKAFEAWSKVHVKESDKARWDTLREMQATYDALSFAKTNMTSSRRLASAHGIGTPEFSQYQSQLASVGPAVRAMMAAKAKAEKNATLAAVLIQLNDAAEKNLRSFNSDELAASIWGQEAQLNKALFDAADLEIQRAIRINREYESKPATALELVEDGLKWGPDGLKESPEDLERKPEQEGRADGFKILKELSDASAKSKIEKSPDEIWADILAEAAA